MKKLFRLAVVALIATMTTLTANAKLVGFGMSAGVSNANYSLKSYSKSSIDNGSGFQVGATATVQIPMISLSPELWYIQNNFDLVNTSIMGYQADVKTHVVNIPVVAGLTVFGPLKIELGPSFNVYDKAKAKLTNGETVDLGRMHSTVGYVAGAKVSILGKVVVGARFNGQFGSRHNNFNGYGDYKVRSYSYSVSLGFKL